MRLGADLLLLAPLVCVSTAARAGAATTIVAGVRVEGPSCPVAPLSFPDFLDVLRVELTARVSPASARVVTIAVAPCDVSTQRVEVRVSAEAGGPSFVREVGLEDVAPAARARALALAVAELVRAPMPAPTVARAAPDGDSPRIRQAPRTPLALAAEAAASFFPSRATVLWGARVGIALSSARSWAGVFADAGTGTASYVDGDVTVRSIGGGVLGGLRREAGRLVLMPALVGTLGWTRVDGHADAADVLARGGGALTAAVRARMGASIHVGGRLALAGFVEGGVVLRRFDATVDGVRAAGVSGASLVVGLGLGLGL